MARTSRYTRALAGASLLLADDLACRESNKTRRDRKYRVVLRKFDLLREAFPAHVGKLQRVDAARSLVEGKWPRPRAVTLLVDLAFSNPFFPYELNFKEKDLESAIEKVAPLVQATAEDVRRVRQTRKEALSAHRHIDWLKIGLCGAGGLAVLGLGAWFAAPAIGAAIGTAAGLSGAAATGHGLAILGGGSLALGGWGMAGGAWLVTGAGATLGLVGGGGSIALLQLGAAAVKVELVKLQVSLKVVVLDTQMELAKAQSIIANLAAHRDEIAKVLEEERLLNEKNAARVKNMEATLQSLEDSIKWMRTTAA